MIYIMIAIILVLFVLVIWLLLQAPMSRSGVRGAAEILTPEDLADMATTKTKFDGKIQSPIYEAGQLDRMRYRRSNVLTTGCHAGQRKLLMTEIQFYTNIPPDSVVIYSGSASGDHTPAILEMFPGIKLILIDPAYHTIDYDYTVIYQNPDVVDRDNLSKVRRMVTSKDQKVSAYAKRLTTALTLDGTRRNMLEPDRIELDTWTQDHDNLGKTIRDGDCRVYIIQDYLTLDLVDRLTECNLGPVCYVSDIRSTMFVGFPSDMDYLWNDALQLYLIKKLRPQFSMLKFHPPYFDKDDDSYNRLIDPEQQAKNPIFQMIHDTLTKVKEFDIDMLDNYSKGKHMYLENSKIYLQAWAPVHSSETRLIVFESDIDKPYINYDHDDWDNRFYYLRYLRTYGYFDMFYKYVKSHNNNPYDGCFDCMLEMFILGKYISKDSSWDMDAAKIAAIISKNPDQVLRLAALVDENLLYQSMRSIKCGMHDQIIAPLRGLNMFLVHNNDLYKASANTKTSTKIRIDKRSLNLASNTRASGLSEATFKRFVNQKQND